MATHPPVLLVEGWRVMCRISPQSTRQSSINVHTGLTRAELRIFAPQVERANAGVRQEDIGSSFIHDE